MKNTTKLNELAGNIRAAHTACRAAAEMSAERALEAGRWLIEAKALVKHGDWADWLEANVGFSQRTARRYMQLVKAGLESATVADLGIRGHARGAGNPAWRAR